MLRLRRHDYGNALFKSWGIDIDSVGATWNDLKNAVLAGIFAWTFVFKNWKNYVAQTFDYLYLGAVAWVNNIAHLFTEVLPKLLEGISFDEAMKRNTTGLEQELIARLKERGEALTEGLANYVDRKMKEFETVKKVVEKNVASSSPFKPSDRGPNAVEQGSLEAYKILRGTQGDKLFGVANQQLAENKKANEYLRKLIDAKGNVVRAANFKK